MAQFENGWGNRAGFQPVEYCKDAQGFADLRGSLQDNDAWVTLSIMFYLPSGCRPAETNQYQVYVSSAGGDPGLVQIASDGSVLVTSASAISIVSLGEIIFYPG